jgi:ribosomal protein S18 acetylase RimI-like enzyme
MNIIKLAPSRYEEYKMLRLRALKEDPQAFGANYEENLAFKSDEWIRRLKNAQEEKTNWLLFAEDDGGLCGMVGAFIDSKDTDAATIYSVYVPLEKRGQGIAVKLMTVMLGKLKNTGKFKKVKLAVNKDQVIAVNFYLKMGFKEVGREDFKMGNGVETKEILMEKPI